MTRFEELLAYFDRLIASVSVGNSCQREMGEVTDALRKELGISSSDIYVDGVPIDEFRKELSRLDSIGKGVK